MQLAFVFLKYGNFPENGGKVKREEKQGRYL